MVLLDGGTLTLDALLAIADGRAEVGLAPSARDQVTRARVVVDTLAAGDAPVYGINTGFGNFAETRIEREDLGALQVNLLRSHAAGVGRAAAAANGTGDDGAARQRARERILRRASATLDALLELLNRGILPMVPSRGSVGASGDLAPLAHLALVLIGEGQTWDGARTEPVPRRWPGQDSNRCHSPRRRGWR
jgi:histidine ammonia-lyase